MTRAVTIGRLLAIETAGQVLDVEEPVALGYKPGIGLFTAPTEEDITDGRAFARPDTVEHELDGVYYEGARSGGRYWRHELAGARFREVSRNPLIPWVAAPHTQLRPDLFLED